MCGVNTAFVVEREKEGGVSKSIYAYTAQYIQEQGCIYYTLHSTLCTYIYVYIYSYTLIYIIFITVHTHTVRNSISGFGATRPLYIVLILHFYISGRNPFIIRS